MVVWCTAAIEEQTVKRLYWTKKFCERKVFGRFPQFVLSGKIVRIEQDKSSWLGEIMRRP